MHKILIFLFAAFANTYTFALEDNVLHTTIFHNANHKMLNFLVKFGVGYIRNNQCEIVKEKIFVATHKDGMRAKNYRHYLADEYGPELFNCVSERLQVVDGTQDPIVVNYTLANNGKYYTQSNPSIHHIYPSDERFANRVVVNSDTCDRLNQPTNAFVLVLKKGEEVSNGILNCLQKAKVKAASFTGIGALANPTLAYFDVKQKKYQDKQLNGIYELVSLVGNMTTLQGQTMTHIHVGLGTNQYGMIAGHLQQATIGVTGEITVTPFGSEIIRKADDGLNLISAE